MRLNEAHFAVAVSGPGFKGHRCSAVGPQKNVDALEYRLDLFAVVARKGGSVKMFPLTQVIDVEPSDPLEFSEEPNVQQPAQTKAKAK